MFSVGTYLIKDANVCKTIVSEALKIGYKLIGMSIIFHFLIYLNNDCLTDTASGYGNEQFIGEVIQNLSHLGLTREQLFITTKLGKKLIII